MKPDSSTKSHLDIPIGLHTLVTGDLEDNETYNVWEPQIYAALHYMCRNSECAEKAEQIAEVTHPLRCVAESNCEIQTYKWALDVNGNAFETRKRVINYVRWVTEFPVHPCTACQSICQPWGGEYVWTMSVARAARILGLDAVDLAEGVITGKIPGVAVGEVFISSAYPPLAEAIAADEAISPKNPPMSLGSNFRSDDLEERPAYAD